MGCSLVGQGRLMPPEGYRGPQVCKIVGITYRQLDHWDRTGLKSPSLVQAKGSGTQRCYSYQDVLELRIIKQLLDAGVTLQRARKAIDFLRESGEELASASLVLGAAGSVLVRDDEELLDLLKGGQRVFNIVALSGVKGDVDAAIVEIVGDPAATTAPLAPLEPLGQPSPGVRPAHLA
jgi:DNA-binding transcriptional MerR regulator